MRDVRPCDSRARQIESVVAVMAGARDATGRGALV